MTDQNKLLQQIDELVASKTFNLDALDAIKKLKDDLSKTLNELDLTKQALLQMQNAYKENDRILTERVLEIAVLKKERDALLEREKKADEAIYAAEKHKAVADTWQSAMAMVFKPNAVRESVQRNVVKPVEGNPGGNGTYSTGGYLATGQETETITREDA